MDFSGLTPDQQFEAGLFCGSVHATPTTPISPTGLCPASRSGSNLVKIPAPGTENDDHNPPRIQPRNLFDIAVGHDNILGGDRFKVSARLTVVNLTDKEALYNFLSTFSERIMLRRVRLRLRSAFISDAIVVVAIEQLGKKQTSTHLVAVAQGFHQFREVLELSDNLVGLVRGRSPGG